MRIGILSPSQKHTDRPERYVSKNAASALLRRLLAVRITKSLIQMVHVRESGLPAEVQVPVFVPAVYEHHLEPRLERLTIADSAWMAYLQGYGGQVEG